MESFKATSSKPISFEPSSLILPIVGLANLSQLASDLLIQTFDLLLVGTLSSADHIPVVGALENGQPGFLSPVEVYQNQQGSVTLIHQRSPPLKARKQDFVNKLLSFIQAARFKQILLLSSLDASTREDSDLRDNQSPFRLLPSSTPLPALESIPRLPSTSPLSKLYLPASGITRLLLQEAASKQVQIDALLMYVVEGDNRGDARALADLVACAVFQVEDTSSIQWKEPRSWDLALYGGGNAQSMFG